MMRVQELIIFANTSRVNAISALFWPTGPIGIKDSRPKQ